MKNASQIVKWGRVKPFLDKTYRFNTIDIETVDNELFLFGYTKNRKHYTIESDFFKVFHEFIIENVQENKDVLTWSRYDNTHLIKLILAQFESDEIQDILLRIDKVTPLCSYEYLGFTFTMVNVIKDSIIFKVTDLNGAEKHCVIYNLKNLYDTDLLKTAENYELKYYSKLGEEFHIIDKNRYYDDETYRKMVIESNRLDNIVLLDIAKNMLQTFKKISGHLPKSIYTNGSLARSYLLAYRGTEGSRALNFKSLFNGSELFNDLLDYSMKSYHGGKIESYVLGYIPKAKIIDITSAYPYAMSLLPKLTNRVIKSTNPNLIKNYFYAFIRCEFTIDDPNLIHPVLVENPINKSNISPYGYMNTTITKISYDYLISKGVKIKVFDFVAVEHEEEYPYKEIVDTLFNNRLKYKKTNPSLSNMYKTILNSLYGITFELTDVYHEHENEIVWKGYRAGDYFNSVIASYITDFTRTYLSEVSHNIIENGGEVFLNMTDSIIFEGSCTLDVFSSEKILGKFEAPTLIKDVYILGAGRYEYRDEFTEKYTIKNRGFSVSVKDKSFYGSIKLNEEIKIGHKTFVTSFKATTKKYSFEKMGYLIDDTYNINPFNLGGKRVIKNSNVNLNKEYIKTYPVYLDEFIYKKALLQ